MSKIAIIDDDKGVIEALQAALELWGHESVGIQDTQKVLLQLKKFQPDIIFLDLLLSGVDGAQVTQTIRKEKKFAHTPIILMSAHPTAKEISQQIQVNGFLPKPFTLDALQKLLTSLQ